MRVSVRAKDFCNLFAKFIGGRKKTPDEDIFFENETPYLLTGEVSQAAHESFSDNESYEFLQLLRLISTFKYIDYVSNVKKMLLRQAAPLHG